MEQTAMTAEQGLYDRLKSVPELTALLGGDAPRIYPLAAPQDAPLPYVVYRLVSDGAPTPQRNGGLLNATLEVAVYGEKPVQVVSIAEIVRAKLDGFQGSGVRMCYYQSAADDALPPLNGNGEPTAVRNLSFSLWRRVTGYVRQQSGA
jgi:hypothetical protein